jgi:PEGA domain
VRRAPFVTRRPAGLLAGALVAATALSMAAGCGGTTPAARSVSLRMRGGPPRATVTIDDRRVGPLDVVAARGVALPPGKHRVSVEAEGFIPWDKEIEATEAPVVLDVTLEPLPD